MPNSDEFVRKFIWLVETAKSFNLDFDCEEGHYSFTTIKHTRLSDTVPRVTYYVNTIEQAIAWIDGYAAGKGYMNVKTGESWSV